jgi:cytidine deaminase
MEVSYGSALSDQSLWVMTERAKAAAELAYSPYSKFRVGCCLKTASGMYIEGCNVENASYGLTSCAERNAIFHMISGRLTPEAPEDMEIVAVVIYTPTQTVSAPCGACRQVINEFAQGDCVILSVCDSEERLVTSLAEILPHAFGPKNLDPCNATV